MPVDDPLSCVWLDLNDLGNAYRLQRLSRGLLLWVDDLGTWASFDGKRWSTREGSRAAQLLAFDVVDHIDKERRALEAIADDPSKLEAAFNFPVSVEIARERLVAMRKHAVKSGDAARTTAMLTQAKNLPAKYIGGQEHLRSMLARSNEFDLDPLTLNLQSGTLRFLQNSAGTWGVSHRPHDPADMLMQISNFSYDPKAQCPRWIERFELIQPDAELRALIRGIFGYALTGLTSEQKWFIFQGKGGDGKSLTNAVIAEGLGDYYRHADVLTFLKGPQRSGSDHSADLARLSGDVRLVTFDEPPRNSTWNAGRLKQVTGGKVNARGVGAKETVEFAPRWKLVGEANVLPQPESDDDGFWRRCRRIEWSYQFDKGGARAEPWDVVVSRLVAELPGILNWMIAGALDWLSMRRLPSASAADEALTEYRQSSAPILLWLDERCDLSDPEALTAAGVLYKDFKDFCDELGVERVPSQTAFGRILRDRQFRDRKGIDGKRFRRGIRLRPVGAPLAPVASLPEAGRPSQDQGSQDWGADDA